MCKNINQRCYGGIKNLHFVFSDSKSGFGGIEDTPLSFNAPAEEAALNHETHRKYVGGGISVMRYLPKPIVSQK